jgi:fido (protein-threonine AMPylation protein)
MDSWALLDTYKYLFQDIYAWAMQTGTVEISKSGRQFFSLNRFGTAFPFIDNLITAYRQINSADIPSTAVILPPSWKLNWHESSLW